MQQTILNRSAFPKFGVLRNKNPGTCPNSELWPVWFQVQIKMLSVRVFQKWMAAKSFYLAVHDMSCRKGRSKGSIGIKVHPWIDTGDSAEKYLLTSHTKPRGVFQDSKKIYHVALLPVQGLARRGENLTRNHNHSNRAVVKKAEGPGQKPQPSPPPSSHDVVRWRLGQTPMSEYRSKEITNRVKLQDKRK